MDNGPAHSDVPQGNSGMQGLGLAFLGAALLTGIVGATVTNALHTRFWVVGAVMVAVAVFFSLGVALLRVGAYEKRLTAPVLMAALVVAGTTFYAVAMTGPDLFAEPAGSYGSKGYYEYRPLRNDTFEVNVAAMPLVGVAGVGEWTDGPAQTAPAGTGRLMLRVNRPGLDVQLVINGTAQAWTSDGYAEAAVRSNVTWFLRGRVTDVLGGEATMHVDAHYEQLWAVTCVIQEDPPRVGEETGDAFVVDANDPSCAGEVSSSPAS